MCTHEHTLTEVDRMPFEVQPRPPASPSVLCVKCSHRGNSHTLLELLTGPGSHCAGLLVPMSQIMERERKKKEEHI